MTILTHLQRLEAESIDIMREAVSECEKPVMLYSVADTLSAIIQEMLLATTSERQGRVIDHDSTGSIEKRTRRGTSDVAPR